MSAAGLAGVVRTLTLPGCRPPARAVTFREPASVPDRTTASALPQKAVRVLASALPQKAVRVLASWRSALSSRPLSSPATTK
ncbi:hypothetical protein ACIBAG_00255 [Streptomyces sp. NPDC051243]|uniref:hypothetical protein n=1 Tax=Streptomyces sp. NPDC051243 TaxID=3365646 RepID=UPI003792875F